MQKSIFQSYNHTSLRINREVTTDRVCAICWFRIRRQCGGRMHGNFWLTACASLLRLFIIIVIIFWLNITFMNNNAMWRYDPISGRCICVSVSVHKVNYVRVAFNNYQSLVLAWVPYVVCRYPILPWTGYSGSGQNDEPIENERAGETDSIHRHFVRKRPFKHLSLAENAENCFNVLLYSLWITILFSSLPVHQNFSSAFWCLPCSFFFGGFVGHFFLEVPHGNASKPKCMIAVWKDDVAFEWLRSILWNFAGTLNCRAALALLRAPLFSSRKRHWIENIY